MADAIRLADLHRLADVISQAIRWHQAEAELAGRGVAGGLEDVCSGEVPVLEYGLGPALRRQGAADDEGDPVAGEVSGVVDAGGQRLPPEFDELGLEAGASRSESHPGIHREGFGQPRVQGGVHAGPGGRVPHRHDFDGSEGRRRAAQPVGGAAGEQQQGQ